ncbi:MAG: IS630 family transposase [Alphaproteobacteria bacterium]|uniref:IS630 family transposase n=1 Tax=Candidatus Nitrobium versatile TaxID=2884831 RepID=A0A953JEE1_9BACT|nr:IS630 family transposase [Candidatus Nitrobium versatile]
MEDGRKLKHDVLELLRIRAVLQVESGESPEAVIKALGLTRGCIYRWMAKYREGGIRALKAKPLDGRPLKLSEEEVRWVFETLLSRCPLQLEFAHALWSREMVSDMIRERYGIKLSITSVGRLLKRLGLEHRKPLLRAFQQNPALVQEWVDREYPTLKRMALRDDAEIFFADETRVLTPFCRNTTKGGAPALRTRGGRFSISMLSAISSRGKVWFILRRGTTNANGFCDFLGRLLHNRSRKIFLVLDGYPVYRSSKVRKFVLSAGGALRLFFLPPYSSGIGDRTGHPYYTEWPVWGIGRGGLLRSSRVKNGSSAKDTGAPARSAPGNDIPDLY